MTQSLRGSVIGVMVPCTLPEEIPPGLGWAFPNPLPVTAVEVRAYDHAQLLQLLDEHGEVLATIVVPSLPAGDDPSPTFPPRGERPAPSQPTSQHQAPRPLPADVERSSDVTRGSSPSATREGPTSA